MMMTMGVILCAAGLLHGVIKYVVIRDAARDIYNGGGVPVLDFAIFVPLWLSVGGTFLLKHYGVYPFPFFGAVVYFVLAAILYGVIELEYRLGRPEVARQLRAIEEREGAEQSAGGEAEDCTPQP